MDNEERKKFLDTLISDRKARAETCVLSLLADLVAENLPYQDVHYIDKRVREIISNAIRRTEFGNPAIAAARAEFVEKMSKEVVKNIEKPKFCRQPKDDTDTRDNRCESISQKLARVLLAPEFIFGDKKEMAVLIADDDRMLLEGTSRSYADIVYEMLINSVDESLRRCNEKIWGVPKHGITFKKIDLLLKS